MSKQVRQLVSTGANLRPCTKCSKTWPEVEFLEVKNRNGDVVWDSRCKSCVRTYIKAWKQERSEALGYSSNRDWHLRSHYGLEGGQAEWDAMFESQGKACAICRRTDPNGKYWHLDHDHDTGKARAILCGTCNQGLGQFQDNAALLRAAADYLDGFGNLQGGEPNLRVTGSTQQAF